MSGRWEKYVTLTKHWLLRGTAIIERDGFGRFGWRLENISGTIAYGSADTATAAKRAAEAAARRAGWSRR
jgi:hypothetical protein